MRMKLTAATALAGSLLLVPLMQGSAQSASVTGLGKPITSTAIPSHWSEAVAVEAVVVVALAEVVATVAVDLRP